jgi:DNA-3-methyladenine glycosylase
VHALLNAVCEPEGVGAAVLIRALLPTAGVEQMRERRTVIRRDGTRRVPDGDDDLCSGPGKLTQALGISLGENGTSLAGGPVRIGPRAARWRSPDVVVGARVGINRAVELPWRFCAAGCRHVSRPRPRLLAA